MPQLFGQRQKTIPRPNRAQQADRLTNPIRIGITGDGDAESILFDGSGNIELDFTLSDTGVVPGTYIYATVTVDAKGRLTFAESGVLPIVNVFVPLTTGEEPIVLVSDGQGQCVMVPTI